MEIPPKNVSYLSLAYQPFYKLAIAIQAIAVLIAIIPTFLISLLVISLTNNVVLTDITIIVSFIIAILIGYLVARKKMCNTLKKNPTLLHAAVVCEDFKNVKVLLKAGLDINMKFKNVYDDTCYTLLDIAPNDEMKGFLLKHGAKPIKQDNL